MLHNFQTQKTCKLLFIRNFPQMVLPLSHFSKILSMARVELVMPKMGESIMEATILKWRKNIGDQVELDEAVLDIATDKVDSEVPSPVAGTLVEILYAENDNVPINKVIALIETEVGAVKPAASAPQPVATAAETVPYVPETVAPATVESSNGNGRFYSPLVRTIAKEEGISTVELAGIAGSGAEGRVTKKDVMAYLAQRQTKTAATASKIQPVTEQVIIAPPPAPRPAVSTDGNVEIVEMDRMRRLIADHMVMSKHVSPHVTSFVEADVTNMVNWRNRIKDKFKQQYGEGITFTPIFVEAVARALRDFPMVNVSVDGTKIIIRKDIHIGMAAALPSGNLIVPVIRHADQLNLVGLTKSVNDLAGRARQGQLKPEEIQGGTFTLTNVGTFGNVMGTPIINQPQAAIMATGAIRKKPAVLETEYGDVIAVRQMMFLSLSYDHRVVDGALGGSFLRRVADYLEGFDANRTI
jgi:2-oxoglutarate dehydrogenase E2 component (dihydrolipoamide succinyltransferase)